MLGFDDGFKKPPTNTLSPIILYNACILCITATVGTELADASSVITSSQEKEFHNPWTFYLQATLQCQAFVHREQFPTAASRRSWSFLSPDLTDHPLGSAIDRLIQTITDHKLNLFLLLSYNNTIPYQR